MAKCIFSFTLWGLRLTNKVDIPCPAAELRVLCVPNPGSVSELVAVPIHSPRFAVIELDLSQAEIRQRVQLGCFGYAIVICVLPQPKARKDRIVPGYETVAVAAVLRDVKNGERQEPIFLGTGGLHGEVAEQLPSGVDRVVSVTVKSQPRIIGIGCRPGQSIKRSVAGDIEIYPICRVG
jgi:hypothetical protein